MIGGHFQLGPSSQATELVVRRAGIVKALGNPGVLQAAKRSAIKIYRPRIRQEDQQFAADEYRQGRDCADQAIAELGGWNDERLFIETWNEPHGQRGPDRVRLARVILGFTDRCHERGYKVAGFCFATGNPEQEDVEYYTSLDWCGVDLVATHGYWGVQGLTDWHALRYRKLWEWSKGKCPPIVITESGRDAIENGKRGWKQCGISAETFRAELVAYRNALAADQASGIPILGSTPFTWAPTRDSNREKDWTDFDMEPFNDLPGDWEPAWSLVQKAPPQVPPGGKMTTTRIGNNYEVIDKRATLSKNGTYPARPLTAIKYIVIHHSAVATDSTPEAIADYHVKTLKWPGIGYHFIVRQAGDTYYTNDLGAASYHVAGRNNECIGICLTGDFTSRAPSEAQLQAARRLVAEVQFALGWFVPVVGHRDIALPGHATACPGNTWAQWKDRVVVTAPKPQDPAPKPQEPTTDWKAVAEGYAERLRKIADLAKV